MDDEDVCPDVRVALVSSVVAEDGCGEEGKTLLVPPPLLVAAVTLCDAPSLNAQDVFSPHNVSLTNLRVWSQRMTDARRVELWPPFVATRRGAATPATTATVEMWTTLLLPPGRGENDDDDDDDDDCGEN